eukprot:4501805-Pyramimonas_sp.AAC.1
MESADAIMDMNNLKATIENATGNEQQQPRHIRGNFVLQDIMALLKNTKKTTHPSYPAEELQPPRDDDEEAVPGAITNEQA